MFSTRKFGDDEFPYSSSRGIKEKKTNIIIQKENI